MFAKLVGYPSIILLFVAFYCLLGQLYVGYRGNDNRVVFGVDSLLWFLLGIFALIGWILYMFA